MFLRIRKTIVVSIYLGLGSFAAWCVLHPEVFQPLEDVYSIWRETSEVKRGYVSEFDAEAVRMLNQRSLRVKDETGTLYTLYLAGIDSNRGRNSRELKEMIQLMVEGQTFRLALTYTNEFRVASGILFVNGTNLNLFVVRNGLAPLERASTRSLPILDQYRMMSAERSAKSSIAKAI